MKKGMKTHTLTADEMPSYSHETIKEKWEDEFDEKIKLSYAKGGFLTIDLGDHWKVDYELVKGFINHAISEAVEKEREKYIVYEDELGEMTYDEYGNWFDNSWIEDGVRVGYKNLIIKNR